MNASEPNPIGDGRRLLLPDHHRVIEAACEALRVATYIDDRLELLLSYRSLERAVLEHLDAEEDALLPAYAASVPEDARAIRATHDELRRQLSRLGIDVELHCVRAEMIERLVQTLRAHAAHEDRGMYPWAQVHLPARTLRELFRRIRRSIRLLALDAERAAKVRAASRAGSPLIRE